MIVQRPILLLMLLITSLLSAAQVFNPDRPTIREFVICVDSINAQLKKYQHPRQMSLKEKDGKIYLKISNE